MQSNPPIRRHDASEDGYMLLAAMFLLFLLALSLSIAAPMVAKSIQRDREVETMERGKQYARAIQVYFRKFNAYPPNIDALVKTNNIRFLRKRYLDPMTGKDDWKPILFGQNKTPLAMGFFGEPLAGGATAIAGTGPSGGNQGGLFGSTAGGTGLTGLGSSPTGATGLTGATGASGPAGTAGSPASGTTGTGSTSGSSGIFGNSNSQTFGGAGIVGFGPGVNRPSILTYKKKNRYNEWEFTYSPILDQMKQMGGNAGNVGLPTSPSMPGAPGTTSPSSPFGGSSTTPTGGSPMGAPTAPTTPPQ